MDFNAMTADQIRDYKGSGLPGQRLWHPARSSDSLRLMTSTAQPSSTSTPKVTGWPRRIESGLSPSARTADQGRVHRGCKPDGINGPLTLRLLNPEVVAFPSRSVQRCQAADWVQLGVRRDHRALAWSVFVAAIWTTYCQRVGFALGVRASERWWTQSAGTA